MIHQFYDPLLLLMLNHYVKILCLIDYFIDLLIDTYAFYKLSHICLWWLVNFNDITFLLYAFYSTIRYHYVSLCIIIIPNNFMLVKKNILFLILWIFILFTHNFVVLIILLFFFNQLIITFYHFNFIFHCFILSFFINSSFKFLMTNFKIYW